MCSLGRTAPIVGIVLALLILAPNLILRWLERVHRSVTCFAGTLTKKSPSNGDDDIYNDCIRSFTVSLKSVAIQVKTRMFSPSTTVVIAFLLGNATVFLFRSCKAPKAELQPESAAHVLPAASCLSCEDFGSSVWIVLSAEALWCDLVRPCLHWWRSVPVPHFCAFRVACPDLVYTEISVLNSFLHPKYRVSVCFVRGSCSKPIRQRIHSRTVTSDFNLHRKTRIHV